MRYDSCNVMARFGEQTSGKLLQLVFNHFVID